MWFLDNQSRTIDVTLSSEQCAFFWLIDFNVHIVYVRIVVWSNGNFRAVLYKLMKNNSCRTWAKNFLLTVKELGRKPPTFADASEVAQAIMDSGYQFDNGSLYYNHFR